MIQRLATAAALLHWHHIAALRAAITNRGKQLQATVAAQQAAAALQRCGDVSSKVPFVQV